MIWRTRWPTSSCALSANDLVCAVLSVVGMAGELLCVVVPTTRPYGADRGDTLNTYVHS